MKKFILSILSILFILIAGDVILNKFIQKNYNDLPEIDQKILNEYNQFYTSKNSLYEGYDLKRQPIVVINKSSLIGTAYLITPSRDIHNLLVKKISLPKHFKIKVFRIAHFTPERLQFIGNFNTHGQSYTMCGQKNLFFVKYTKKLSIEKKWSSSHFLPFLVHEAFHYYGQKYWEDFSFRGIYYSEKELDLLAKEYILLDEIHKELKSMYPDKSILNNYVKKYVSVMENRIENTDSKKIRMELGTETMEGIAEYVGIKAAKIINYDYDIMYFDNQRDVKFSDVVPTIKAGRKSQSVLGNKIVYSSGALLCKLLDILEGRNWQKKLSLYPHGLTLYSLIKEYSENIEK